MHIGEEMRDESEHWDALLTQFGWERGSMDKKTCDCPVLKYQEWQKQKKKLRRKQKRQQRAKQAAEEQSSEFIESSSPEHNSEEEQARAGELLWIQREREAQSAWQAKLDWNRIAEERKRKQEELIKAEWEAKQAAERAAVEEKAKEEEEKKRKQTHNPAPPKQQSFADSKDVCHFYLKTGACRFRDSCSRTHIVPEISKTLLLANMYTHPSLDDHYEYDTDISLEFDDSELYQNFKDFYYDVLSKFREAGKVVQFKVCRNYEAHLRGNVYVQFTSENEAYKAYTLFNGRWYGGKQVQCSFSPVDKWKAAICGLYHQKRCPKGKSCNFLHAFRNPDHEFNLADRDIFPQERPASERYNRERRYSDRAHREYASERHNRDRSMSVRSDYHGDRWSSDSEDDERANSTDTYKEQHTRPKRSHSRRSESPRRNESRDRSRSYSSRSSQRDEYNDDRRHHSDYDDRRRYCDEYGDRGRYRDDSDDRGRYRDDSDDRGRYRDDYDDRSRHRDYCDDYDDRSRHRDEYDNRRQRTSREYDRSPEEKRKKKKKDKHESMRRSDKKKNSSPKEINGMSTIDKEKELRENLLKKMEEKKGIKSTLTAIVNNNGMEINDKAEDWRYCRTPSICDGSSPEYDAAELI